MKVVVRNSFERDVRKVTRKERGGGAARQIEQTIDELKSSIEGTSSKQNIFQLSSVKKLGDARVGDYRIGLRVVGDSVEFVKLSHRRDFYKHFP